LAKERTKEKHTGNDPDSYRDGDPHAPIQAAIAKHQ